MLKYSKFINTCPILLQDALCRHQYCQAAFRCWNGPAALCCWPPENDTECHPPGLPVGWQRPGGDPAGVSNNEVLGTAQIAIV